MGWGTPPLILAIAAAGGLAAAESPENALKSLLEKLREGTGAISAVLNQYGRLEAAGSIDPFGRLHIHQGLLKAIREIRKPEIVEEADRFLQLSGSVFFPGQVILLKAIAAPRFPAPREKRVEMLARAAAGRDERLSVWGARLLGEAAWPEAVESLIDLLRREEDSRRPESLLASVARGELYRILGAPASSGVSAQIQKNWEALGKKLPERPDYRRSGGPAATGFFGDRLSPRAVFVLDASSSMLQRTTLAGASKKTAVKGEREPPGTGGEPKIEIVRAELLRAIDQLQPHFKFNILIYNAAAYPWRGQSRPLLYPATSTSVSSAVEFAKTIQVASGTNIHDALARALEIPEVETIYLLSDGVPSRGGGPPEIERRVEALNYLRGARIIAYGFAAEERGAYDEEFMIRLARNNWGWYRRLNR